MCHLSGRSGLFMPLKNEKKILTEVWRGLTSEVVNAKPLAWETELRKPGLKGTQESGQLGVPKPICYGIHLVLPFCSVRQWG